MAALLPFIAWAAAVALLLRLFGQVALALLVAAVGLASYAVVVTEVLSAWGAISAFGLQVAWGVAALGLVMSHRFVPDAVDLHLLPPPGTRIPVALGVLLVAAVLVLALAAPPNTWDSMTYHLPRVMHWIQNGSLRFYPTHNERQNCTNPGAELLLLQLRLLSGGDRLVGLVSWSSLVVAMVAAWEIVRGLGGSAMASAWGAVLSAASPMAILQASGTQTDLVCGAWVSCFVALALSERLRPTVLRSAVLGLALGLAVLTKATAVFFAAPFCLLLLVREFQSQKPLVVLRGWLALALIAGAVCSPHALRNWAVYGTPAGQTTWGGDKRYANDAMSLRLLTSNVLRNLALEVKVPWPRVNGWVFSGLGSLHQALDVRLDDPRITWPKTRPEAAWQLQEDLASSPLQGVLFLGALIAGLRARAWTTVAGLGGLAAGFIVFCALIRWQLYNARLHLPLLLLEGPLVALALERGLPRILPLAGTVAAACAMAVVIVGSPRGLKSFRGRSEWQFATAPEREASYGRALDAIARRGCTSVGLVLGWDYWEYPLWTFGAQDTELRIRAVAVDNATAALAPEFEETPCAFVVARWYPKRLDDVPGMNESRLAFRDELLEVWAR